ncbi:MAG: alkaline phosphatase family protein [Candidatus Eiseniibacteriota bacterium]
MSRVRSFASVLLVPLLGGCAADPREPTVAEAAAPRPVFILGFDGIDPGILARFENEGLLPNFAALRREGAVGAVRSTIPSISPPAWTTVVTGVPPSDHGIWSFWLPQGDDPRGRYVDATCRLAPAIWEDLTTTGRTVGIVNVPVTSPPDSVNGFLISGFPYPEGAPLTFPPDLEADILRRGYLRDQYGGAPEPGREEQWLQQVQAIARAQREVGLDLLFERRPDLSFIVFTAPDRIQHHLWKFHDPEHPRHDASAPAVLREAVRESYVFCDDVLGEVRDRLPDEAVLFVLSDHGFGPAYWGISKARVLADLGEAVPSGAGTRNVFGGDFWLGGADSTRRAAFARGLEGLRDDRGRPLVQRVHDTRSEASRGYGRDLGPEIVAEEAEGFVFVPGNSAADALTGVMPARSFSAYHRRLGYFAACGPPIVAGPVRDLDLADVPAVALHVLGEKVPRRYLHNFPRKVFPATYFVERPMLFSGDSRVELRRPGTTAPVGVDAGVEEQLRALGYVQ